MDDLISRQAAIDALYKMLHDCFLADDEELDAVVTTLNDLPSAQPEIIRCRECVHSHPNFCAVWSRFETVQTHPDGWCYKAERRES